jgi:hypothetical protein
LLAAGIHIDRIRLLHDALNGEGRWLEREE